MQTLKKYAIYIIVIAAFWFFSDILIYLAINGSYTSIETKVFTNTPEVSILQSKATYINGVVKGNIYNNTDATINQQYVKIDLYSARKVKLGTKYIPIHQLDKGKTQYFEMWYKLTDVDYATISVTDDVMNATEEEFISQETAGYIVMGTLLVLYFL